MSKITLTEVYRPSRRVLDWLANNAHFGLALEGIASGKLYYVMKLKDRARVEAARARKAARGGPRETGIAGAKQGRKR